MDIPSLILLAVAGLVALLTHKYMKNPPQETEYIPPQAPKPAPEPPLPVTPPPMPETLDWTTPKGVYHAVRVTCDNAKLSLKEKDIITACIYQESQFKNSARCDNIKNGKIWSSDFGICQINDYYHIGKGKDFPSVDYVLKNPEKVVQWMIKMYLQGQLKQWVSYSSGAYKQWLLPTSPMWKYKTK